MMVVWCGASPPVERMASGQGWRARQGPRAPRPAVESRQAKGKPVTGSPRSRPSWHRPVPRAAPGERPRAGAAPLPHQRPAPQHRLHLSGELRTLAALALV